MGNPLTFGSLFAGIGGLDLGLERAGMVCGWQVEKDASCNKVLAHHWPDVPRFEDVCNVGRSNLNPVDVICGGFPCQDVSVAGRRAGLAGERSGLWFEYHRVLDELRPRWAVIENVPGLLSSNGGRDFRAILRGLVELGYGVSYRILDAQYFGVAQRRRRVFIVGSLGDGRSTQVLFESEGGGWNPAPRRETGQGVAGTLESGTNGTGGTRPPGTTVDTAEYLLPWEVAPALSASGRGTSRSGESRGQDCVIPVAAYGGNRTAGEIDVATACNAHGGSGRMDFESETFVCARSTGAGWYTEDDKASLRAEPGGTTFDLVTLTDCVGTLRANAGMPKHEADNGKLVLAFDWQSGGDVRLNISEDHTSAIQSCQVPLALGTFGVRRLTPVECERLQGFPDNWTANQSDSARYRQLGDAVCVPVAEWIGKRIVAVEYVDG